MEELRLHHLRPTLQRDLALEVVLDEPVQYIEVVRATIEGGVDDGQVLDIVVADPLDLFPDSIRVKVELGFVVALWLLVLTECASKLAASLRLPA